MDKTPLSINQWTHNYLACTDGITIKDSNTTRTYWTDADGRYHRDNGLPAIITVDNHTIWLSWYEHGVLVGEGDEDIQLHSGRRCYYEGRTGENGANIIKNLRNGDKIYTYGDNTKIIFHCERTGVTTTTYGTDLEYAESECGRGEGNLHRTDGPAVEFSDGGYEYWVDNKLHRVDGPAVSYPDGTELYYTNGKLHRTNGPAWIKPENGKIVKKYYLRGHRVPGFII